MAFDHVHLKLSLSNDGLIPAWVILSHQSRLFYIKSGISNCLPRPPTPVYHSFSYLRCFSLYLHYQLVSSGAHNDRIFPITSDVFKIVFSML